MLFTLDPYTEYFPEEDQSELEQMIKGSFGGIGSYIAYNTKLKRCLLYTSHVPIIIFEEIIRLSYYAGESFLWNGLRLFSTIGKGVIFDGYYICLNMEGRKR